MEIEVIRRSEEQLEEYDYQYALIIKIDGKEVLSCFDGEPEDNSLCRNFNDVFSVPTLLKMAHKAGVDGEPISITSRNFTDDD